LKKLLNPVGFGSPDFFYFSVSFFFAGLTPAGKTPNYVSFP